MRKPLITLAAAAAVVLLGTAPLLAHGPVQVALPESVTSPWLKTMQIDWTPAFALAPEHEGYDSLAASIATALEAPAVQGGWKKKDRPSLVVVWNPRSEDHRKLLEMLRADDRFNTATHLFNCYRIDSRSLRDADPRTIYLSAFRKGGRHVGYVSGKRKLKGEFDLLERTWALDHDGARLTKALPPVRAALKQVARADYQIERLEKLIVCPHCGERRDDIQKQIARLRKQREEARKRLVASDD